MYPFQNIDRGNYYFYGRGRQQKEGLMLKVAYGAYRRREHLGPPPHDENDPQVVADRTFGEEVYGSRFLQKEKRLS